MPSLPSVAPGFSAPQPVSSWFRWSGCYCTALVGRLKCRFSVVSQPASKYGHLWGLAQLPTFIREGKGACRKAPIWLPKDPNLLTEPTYHHVCPPFVSVPPVLLGSGVGAALLVYHLVTMLGVTSECRLGQAQLLALVVEQDFIPSLRPPGGGDVGHCWA